MVIEKHGNIYTLPDTASGVIYYPYPLSLEVLKVKGNWMKVDNGCEGCCPFPDDTIPNISGWIKFKEKDRLLITLIPY